MWSNVSVSHSKMPPLDQTAKALYSKFSVAQLRELALASKIPSDRIAQLRSRDEALGTIDAISDQHRLALLAHRVETLSPYKHCVLLEAKSAFTYLDVSRTCRKAFKTLFESFEPLNSDSQDIVAQLCIDDSSSKRIFIKFAHMVEVWESKKTSEGLLKSKVWRRHIMVVEINPAIQVVSIGSR